MTVKFVYSIALLAIGFTAGRMAKMPNQAGNPNGGGAADAPSSEGWNYGPVATKPNERGRVGVNSYTDPAAPEQADGHRKARANEQAEDKAESTEEDVADFQSDN
jgi:hypothetical protein